MITGLDHIAIAVPDLQAAIARFANDFGLTFKGAEDVESAATSTAFFPIEDTQIELVHPLRGKGPIAKHIEKRGPGLHHLAFRTDDIDADVERLRGLGYQFTSESPQEGAHNTRVIFIHPKSTEGVLIELVEHSHHAR